MRSVATTLIVRFIYAGAALFQVYVDTHLNITGCTDLDLANMAWFGQRAALVTVGRRARFERVAEASAWWERESQIAARRLRAAGLQAHLALGILHDQRPRRWHEHLWNEFAQCLALPDVSAVGPVRVDPDDKTLDTCTRTLMIAREFDLPALLVPHSQRMYGDTERLLALSAELGLAPDRVIVARCDYTTLRMVVRFGALACVSVGPDQLSARDAARMLHEFNPTMWRNLALSTSAVAGATDVLAIPKLLRELGRYGLDASQLRAVSSENTRRWLDRGRVGRSRVAPD